MAQWLSTDTGVNYFAFGASMSSLIMRKRLGWDDISTTKLVDLTTPRQATLKDYRLTFGVVQMRDGSQEVRANIVAEQGSVVEGVVYRLSPEALDFLDYRASSATRVPVEVDVKGKKTETVKAQAYVSSISPKPEIPSPEYVQQMLDGAREFGVPPAYIAQMEDQLLLRSHAAAD